MVASLAPIPGEGHRTVDITRAGLLSHIEQVVLPQQGTLGPTTARVIRPRIRPIQRGDIQVRAEYGIGKRRITPRAFHCFIRDGVDTIETGYLWVFELAVVNTCRGMQVEHKGERVTEGVGV